MTRDARPPAASSRRRSRHPSPLLPDASEVNARIEWSLRERGRFPTVDDLRALRDVAYLRRESTTERTST